MRLIIASVALLAALATGCGDDSSTPTRTTTTPTNYEVLATTNWFVTSPDVNDLSQFSSCTIVVTFTSNVGDDLTFNSPPQFQLWSDPDTYDFVSEAAVTVNAEPSGSVAPGNTFSFDLTVDLTNIPGGQTHIAIRPVDDNLYGTLGPQKVSVFSSDVEFSK